MDCKQGRHRTQDLRRTILCLLALFQLARSFQDVDDALVDSNDVLDELEKRLSYAAVPQPDDLHFIGYDDDDTVLVPVFSGSSSPARQRFIGKRSLDDLEGFDKRRSFIGKRSDELNKRRSFIGKRFDDDWQSEAAKRRSFIGKRIPGDEKRRSFIGKKSVDNVNKRRSFIGKRLDSGLPQEETDLISNDELEKRRSFIGKRNSLEEDKRRSFIGKKNDDEPLETGFEKRRSFIGKKDEVADKRRSFIGKKNEHVSTMDKRRSFIGKRLIDGIPIDWEGNEKRRSFIGKRTDLNEDKRRSFIG